MLSMPRVVVSEKPNARDNERRAGRIRSCERLAKNGHRHDDYDTWWEEAAQKAECILESRLIPRDEGEFNDFSDVKA